MHGSGIGLLASVLLLLDGESVLITRKGEKIEGPVTRDGAHYVVETITGARRFPEAEVALVFDTIRDVTQRADERFQEVFGYGEPGRAVYVGVRFRD